MNRPDPHGYIRGAIAIGLGLALTFVGVVITNLLKG